MTPPKHDDDLIHPASHHPAPCPPLVWFRAAVVAVALFGFGVASSVAGILWTGSTEAAKRLTASETAAAALAARVDERLRAIEASQGRMERTLDTLAARTRSGTTLGAAVP